MIQRSNPTATPIRTAAFALALGLVASAPLAGPAAAQDAPGDAPRDRPGARAAPIDPESAPRPTARVTRTSDPIRIDGRLDEAAWRAADSITGFVQAQPRTGRPATERTVVRVLYDRDFLYIGAICYDSDPSGIVARSLEQDFQTHNEDVFAVTLDTYLDRRNSFMFLVNPNGAVKDGQTFDNSRNFNLAWEGVVHVETRIHDAGWTVELAIPFTTLRFDPDGGDQALADDGDAAGPAWGANFLRRIRRKNEDAYWAPLDRRDRVHRMARAGTLTGLAGLRAGRNIAVKPFALAARTTGGAAARAVPADGAADGAGTGDAADGAASAAAADVAFDGGMDMKWGITPRLTLDLTWRTDFSQVEVDQERVNLTRFPLFFPEKRDFFLENSGIFTFGDVSVRNYRMGASLRDFTLFHSRRVGLTDDGRPIPILGGGRLTGRLAGFEVGLLEMQTRASADGPAENFAVARLRRPVPGGDVGAIVINRKATGADADGAYNRGYGADLNLRLFGNLFTNAYLAATAAPGTDAADATAARLAVAWRDPFWDASAMVKRVDDAFDPGVGFIRRRAMRHAYGTVGIHPRPAWPFIQELNPYVEADYITGLDAGLLETRNATAGLDVEFLDGGMLRVEYTDRYERLSEPFRVRSDATVPAGAYGFRELTASYRSNAGRPLSANVRLTRGGYFSGTRSSAGAGALWRPNAHLSFDLSVSRNAVTLPGRAFTADVTGARVQYAFSTRAFASGFVQYNAAADQLVTNVRLNWIHAPLSDLFLVWTERRDLAAGGAVDRALTANVTKRVGF